MAQMVGASNETVAHRAERSGSKKEPAEFSGMAERSGSNETLFRRASFAQRERVSIDVLPRRRESAVQRFRMPLGDASY